MRVGVMVRVPLSDHDSWASAGRRAESPKRACAREVTQLSDGRTLGDHLVRVRVGVRVGVRVRIRVRVRVRVRVRAARTMCAYSSPPASPPSFSLSAAMWPRGYLPG